MAVRGTRPSPPSPGPNPNPNRRGTTAIGANDTATPSKRVLAFHFVRALARIHRSSNPLPRRSRTIRRAAYSSMARAANPRRAWSRALLQQMRARRARSRPPRAVLLRRRVVSAAPATATPIAGEEATAAAAALARPPAPRQAGDPARADALRRLVPGGDEMEYSCLLEETADYVRCLRAQVQLMQGLVDLFSANDRNSN